MTSAQYPEEVDPREDLTANDIARLEDMSLRWAQDRIAKGDFGGVLRPVGTKVNKVKGRGYLAWRDRNTMEVKAS